MLQITIYGIEEGLAEELVYDEYFLDQTLALIVYEEQLEFTLSRIIGGNTRTYNPGSGRLYVLYRRTKINGSR